MTISPQTQVLLTQAYEDLSAAQLADQVQSSAQSGLDNAQKTLDKSKSDSLASHQVATKSAHDFIEALSVELQFPLPVSF